MLKNQYGLRVVAVTGEGPIIDFPESVGDALDAFYTLPRAAFAYEDLRRVLDAERNAYPYRELRLVCGQELSMVVGRLRRDLGLRGSRDDALLQFHSGGRSEALYKERGLKTIRRIDLAGRESYDRLVEAVGQGFVLRSRSGGRRVESHEDYGRLLRNADGVRWVQAQEYLEGSFFHIDTIHDGRRRLFQAVSEYSCSPQQAEGRVFGSMPLARGDGLEVALRSFASRVHQLLRPSDLSTHMKVVLTGGEPVLVDVMACIPTVGVQRCLRSNFSINVADLDLQVQTGLPVPTLDIEPVPAFWLRIPDTVRITRRGSNPSAEVKSLADFDTMGEVLHEVGEGRCVLVRHFNRDLLRGDFERVSADAQWVLDCDESSVDGSPIEPVGSKDGLVHKSGVEQAPA